MSPASQLSPVLLRIRNRENRREGWLGLEITAPEQRVIGAFVWPLVEPTRSIMEPSKGNAGDFVGMLAEKLE
jgi:hypothetical protein